VQPHRNRSILFALLAAGAAGTVLLAFLAFDTQRPDGAGVRHPALPPASSLARSAVASPSLPPRTPPSDKANLVASTATTPSNLPPLVEATQSLPLTIDPRVARVVDPATPAQERLSTMIELADIPHEVRHPEDTDALLGVLRNPLESDVLRNELCNFFERSDSPALAPLLLQILRTPGESERFRAFCIQHLSILASKPESQSLRAEINRTFAGLLNDSQESVRREAMLALVRGRDPAASRAVAAALENPADPAMHDLAIRCCRDLGMTQHIQAVRAFLHSTDEEARISAIVTLSQWRDAASSNAFESAAASSNPRLRQAGQTAIRTLDRAH
jgi:hypothetical protein